MEPRFLVNIMKRKLEEIGVRTKEDLEEYIDREVDVVFNDEMVAILNIIKIFLKLNEKLYV